MESLTALIGILFRPWIAMVLALILFFIPFSLTAGLFIAVILHNRIVNMILQQLAIIGLGIVTGGAGFAAEGAVVAGEGAAVAAEGTAVVAEGAGAVAEGAEIGSAATEGGRAAEAGGTERQKLPKQKSLEEESNLPQNPEEEARKKLFEDEPDDIFKDRNKQRAKEDDDDEREKRYQKDLALERGLGGGQLEDVIEGLENVSDDEEVDEDEEINLRKAA